MKVFQLIGAGYRGLLSMFRKDFWISDDPVYGQIDRMLDEAEADRRFARNRMLQ